MIKIYPYKNTIYRVIYTIPFFVALVLIGMTMKQTSEIILGGVIVIMSGLITTFTVQTHKEDQTRKTIQELLRREFEIIELALLKEAQSIRNLKIDNMFEQFQTLAYISHKMPTCEMLLGNDKLFLIDQKEIFVIQSLFLQIKQCEVDTHNHFTFLKNDISAKTNQEMLFNFFKERRKRINLLIELIIGSKRRMFLGNESWFQTPKIDLYI